MSKPLKFLFVTFDKLSTFTNGGGSDARDYAPMFVSEKCDMFIMQATRMFNAGSNNNSIGTITRKFDQGSRVVSTNGNPAKSYGWFPPYFFESIQLQTTTGTFTNWMCDKFSFSPSLPFSILNTEFYLPSSQATGTPPNTSAGMHLTTFNSENGQNIVVGSYCQFGNVNLTAQSTGFRECLNYILNYSGNNPLILFCNLNMTNSFVKNAFTSSNAVNNCVVTSLDNPIITSIAPSGASPQYSTTITPGYYIITKGLSINVDLLPMAPTTSPDIEYPANVEFPPLVVTLNNFIIQNKSTTFYGTTLSEFLSNGGGLNNNLLS